MYSASRAVGVGIERGSRFLVAPNPCVAPAGGVRSVLRALALLRVMAAVERSEWSLDELSRATELPKATCYRLLATMTQAGFVEQGITPGYYRLGLEAAVVGHATMRTRKHEAQIRAILNGVRRRTKETTGLSVLSGNHAVTVVRVHSVLPLREDLAAIVNGIYPAHASSGGRAMLSQLSADEVVTLLGRPGERLTKVTQHTIGTVAELLADLERVRRDGYALDDQQMAIGLRCLSVPVRARGASPYAIGVVMPSSRGDATALLRSVPLLQFAADELTPLLERR